MIRGTHRRGGLPDGRGKSPHEMAQGLALYLTRAAHDGYLDEAVTHAKTMLGNVRVSEDAGTLWYVGYRLEWRGKQGRPQYTVFSVEHNGDSVRRGRERLAAASC